jgi:hypothetical protein
MKNFAPVRFAFLLCLTALAPLATVAFAQSTPTAPPPQMPGPITPPSLLEASDKPIPQCVGLPSAAVKIEFVVNTSGDPTDVHVVESPSDKHSACAVEIVRAYKYVPAMRDGHAIAIKLVLTLNVAEKTAQ